MQRFLRKYSDGVWFEFNIPSPDPGLSDVLSDLMHIVVQMQCYKEIDGNRFILLHCESRWEHGMNIDITLYDKISVNWTLARCKLSAYLGYDITVYVISRCITPHFSMIWSLYIHINQHLGVVIPDKRQNQRTLCFSDLYDFVLFVTILDIFFFALHNFNK